MIKDAEQERIGKMVYILRHRIEEAIQELELATMDHERKEYIHWQLELMIKQTDFLLSRYFGKNTE